MKITHSPMKALVLKEYNKLVYEDVPVPEINADEVLIRVKACGICGSDVHGMDGSSGRRIPPLIMGHEASGIIEKVGAAVKKWRPGQRVTFDSTIYDPSDWYARRGQYNLADNRQVLGVSTGEYKRHGAFAEYVAVPNHILYEIPENVSFEEAAMVEPVAVGCHALSLAQTAPGDTTLVVGAGIIGLFLIQLLKNSNASKVIAVDIDDEKLIMAKKLGADIAINPGHENAPKVIAGATEGRGADVAFEAVGIEKTVNFSIENVRKGGTVVLVGNLAKEVQFPLQPVVTRQIRVQGSCAINGEYPEVLKLLEEGKIDVKPLLSKSAPLSEGAFWFDRFYRKQRGLFKVILKP